MNTLSPEERERLRALYEKATPGEWHVDLEDISDPESSSIIYIPLTLGGPDAISVLFEADWASEEDVGLVVALHNTFPSILHTLEMVEQERERLRHERDQAVEEANRRDQKWMDGINAIVGRKLRYTLATITDAPGFDLVPDLQDFIQSLRAELAAAKEREQGLRDELAYLKESMARVAQEFGISTPLLLMAMAENNEETYTDILIKHIRKTLSAQPPPSPWRDIATAPKDGTRILACTIGSDAHRQWWSRDRQLWMIDYADGPSWQPTHWMPLPQPPTKGGN